MRWFILALVQVLVIGANVNVSKGAPPVQTIGAISVTIPCGDADEWNRNLQNKYKERVIFKGIAKGGVMKFYANDQTSTFTVVYETGELTCIVIAGNFLIKETQGTPL